MSASNKEIQFGVLVGHINKKKLDQPLSDFTTFAEELSVAAKQKKCQVFFFRPTDFEPTNQTITGITYKNEWTVDQFPLPDVVYNRLLSRKWENHPKTILFIEALQHNRPFFNKGYLDKDQVFSTLRKVAKLRPYLPNSTRYFKNRNLQQFLNTYSVIYLKPTKGSLGKGIIRIRTNDHSTFTCHQTLPTKTRQITFPSFSKLNQFIVKQTNKQTYLMQEGIDVLTLDQRPIDFRALVQKDKKGQWKLTSLIARVAKRNQHVCNVAKGGSMMAIKPLLQQLPHLQSTIIFDRLKKSAIEIATMLDKNTPGTYGEFGIDLAINKQGYPKLLEVNTKPSKNNPLPSKHRVRPSIRYLLQYVRFLAHQAKGAVKEELHEKKYN